MNVQLHRMGVNKFAETEMVVLLVTVSQDTDWRQTKEIASVWTVTHIYMSNI